MDYIGIKVPRSSSVPKCVKALRRLLPLSIGEVKRRIAEDDYLYRGSFIGAEEVDMTISVYYALTNVGIDVQCYEHSRPILVDC